MTRKEFSRGHMIIDVPEINKTDVYCILTDIIRSASETGSKRPVDTVDPVVLVVDFLKMSRYGAILCKRVCFFLYVPRIDGPHYFFPDVADTLNADVFTFHVCFSSTNTWKTLYLGTDRKSSFLTRFRHQSCRWRGHQQKKCEWNPRSTSPLHGK